ncbi:VTT domain-containing protein [Ancylobacter pratisalsi]|uniref:Phospholipase D n=1 Tax=Ancylobacter pratisalsi TaxID=1745854 RepID=A0A6P1YLD3_9HYPH|nr:VTT domain-containing protein [Ancylobacter pratisalsi]QIB33790.1 phospholipase [Ancylobacter pratisalsi]
MSQHSLQLAEDLVESALAERPVPPTVAPPERLGEGPLLRPGRNTWKVEQAARASVLVDGGAYFGALRQAMTMARDTIHICGWDLDSRMKLVDESGEAKDGLPETLADFLSALVKRNPRLRVRLLLWDYSVLFAFERELTPLYSFLWSTPAQIELCLDDALPLGASHHQKVVVIDDAIAFSGGLDLTRRRWDVSEHLPDDPRRTDPTGARYAPFHDVQMAVDGPAARALGKLFLQRWQRAACERLPSSRPNRGADRWPDRLVPDFHDVGIGIARTLPAYPDAAEVREVETLFFDMVDVAERYIYIENQFFTCEHITGRLVERMSARPELEVVIVMPQGYRGWFEHRAMGIGRQRVLEKFAAAGMARRVRMLYPESVASNEATPIMVHSKVTIIDDRILRIGSANLCNRSMGFDSECDLVVDAADEKQRAAVAAVRDRLLAEHVGMSPEEVGAIVERTGSLAAVLDASDEKAARRLVEVSSSAGSDEFSMPAIDALADPIEPIYDERPEPEAPGRLKWIIPVVAAVAVIVALVLAWSYSPFTEPEKIIGALEGLSQHPWAPALMVVIFVLGGLVVFPVTVLMVATVAVFGGWSGAILAAIGALASAAVTFGIGRYLGAGLVRRFIGPRIGRIRRGLADQGVLTVATMRLVPIAPFTFVNLVAGAAELRFIDYMLGSAIGMLPGLVVMTALGRQIVELVTAPSLLSVAALIGVIMLWVLCSFGLQLLVSRFRRTA